MLDIVASTNDCCDDFHPFISKIGTFTILLKIGSYVTGTSRQWSFSQNTCHQFLFTSYLFSTANTSIFAINFLKNILLFKFTITTIICCHYVMKMWKYLYLGQIIVLILTTTKFIFMLVVIQNTYDLATENSTTTQYFTGKKNPLNLIGILASSVSDIMSLCDIYYSSSYSNPSRHFFSNSLTIYFCYFIHEP